MFLLLGLLGREKLDEELQKKVKNWFRDEFEDENEKTETLKKLSGEEVSKRIESIIKRSVPSHVFVANQMKIKATCKKIASAKNLGLVGQYNTGVRQKEFVS